MISHDKFYFVTVDLSDPPVIAGYCGHYQHAYHLALILPQLAITGTGGSDT